jgi:hypothetical protein
MSWSDSLDEYFRQPEHVSREPGYNALRLYFKRIGRREAFLNAPDEVRPTTGARLRWQASHRLTGELILILLVA